MMHPNSPEDPFDPGVTTHPVEDVGGTGPTTASTKSAEPENLGDTVRSAADKARADAVKAAGQAIPAVKQAAGLALRGAAYGAVYGAAFGATFIGSVARELAPKGVRKAARTGVDHARSAADKVSAFVAPPPADSAPKASPGDTAGANPAPA